ncbi:hypothetical protein BDR06DRAFT_946032 [Suillus hirtellus]|nr:hypothetical protein BDR06DRAFT_946032 [Suillus hirtellus]
MHVIYASIPVICYDIFLVVLAIAILRKHLKERKGFEMKPNTYVVMIVRHHVLYFVLNLATQIFIATLWAHPSVWFPVILQRYYLTQACTDGGAVSDTVVQAYRAVYYCATSHYQHLGYACQ